MKFTLTKSKCCSVGGKKNQKTALSWTEYRSAKLESTFPRELANSIFVKSRQLEKAFRGRIRWMLWPSSKKAKRRSQRSTWLLNYLVWILLEYVSISVKKWWLATGNSFFKSSFCMSEPVVSCVMICLTPWTREKWVM